MKSMRPPLVAIFFMTYFHGTGGPAPTRPLDPLLGILYYWFSCHICSRFFFTDLGRGPVKGTFVTLRSKLPHAICPELGIFLSLINLNAL